MKQVLVIVEGAADLPLDAFKGKTPLHTARCPHADKLAEQGRSGSLRTVEEGWEHLHVPNLGRLLGMEKEQARTLHRGPLEAIAMGCEVPAGSWAFCGNFVTLDGTRMTECNADQLSLEETSILAESLRNVEDLPFSDITVAGPGYLNVLLPVEADQSEHGIPPGEVLGLEYRSELVASRKNTFLADLVGKTHDLLRDHEINEVRVDLGENPANAVWLWGGGPAPEIKPFFPFSPGQVCVLTQSSMARGLARVADVEVVDMESPWQPMGLAPAFKVPAVVEALRQHEMMIVYVEAPKPQGRYGTAQEKIRALEALDTRLIGPLATLLQSERPYRMALLPDRAVSTRTGRTDTEEVPVVLKGEGILADTITSWSEQDCLMGSLDRLNIKELWKRLTKE